MAYYRCDHCKNYVEAEKCINNNSTARVFVHEDDLPAVKSWFVFLSDDINVEADRNCWSIDPADDLVCLPKGDDIYIFVAGFDYTDCSDCESDIGENGGRGGGAGGGGGDGGGGGGGSGGGNGGVLPPGVDPSGIKVTVCAGHEARATALGWDIDNLYIPRAAEFAEAFISLSANICVSVPTGPIVNDPANAFWIAAGVNFENCSDCTDGYEATLCAEDEELAGAEDAPEIWIRKGNYDAAIDGFAYGAFCYDVGGVASLMPEDVFILNPTVNDPCETCNRGVKYVLCANETEIEQDYYADSESIAEVLADNPLLTFIYMRIGGVCHSLDLTATSVKIPPEANIVEPRCVFVDCEACLCDGALQCDGGDNKGVPVYLCAFENPAGWRPTYVKEDDLPAALTYFLHRGYCVWIDPTDTPVEIPPGADTVKINNQFNNCMECLWGRPPIPNLPPFPPFPLPPLPPENFYQLKDCETGELTGWWLREIFICAIFGVVPCDIRKGVFKVIPLGIGLPEHAKCYEAVPPAALDKPPGVGADRWVVDGMFADCEDCLFPTSTLPYTPPYTGDPMAMGMLGFNYDEPPATPAPETWAEDQPKPKKKTINYKRCSSCSRAKKNK